MQLTAKVQRRNPLTFSAGKIKYKFTFPKKAALVKPSASLLQHYVYSSNFPNKSVPFSQKDAKKETKIV